MACGWWLGGEGGCAEGGKMTGGELYYLSTDSLYAAEDIVHTVSEEVYSNTIPQNLSIETDVSVDHISNGGMFSRDSELSDISSSTNSPCAYNLTTPEVSNCGLAMEPNSPSTPLHQPFLY